jgi:mandelate racemase
MSFEKLTFRSVTVRPVVVPLRRPVVSRVGYFDQWPLILIDLQTEEGVVGRSYLEPYLKQSARYLVPASSTSPRRVLVTFFIQLTRSNKGKNR